MLGDGGKQMHHSALFRRDGGKKQWTIALDDNY